MEGPLHEQSRSGQPRLQGVSSIGYVLSNAGGALGTSIVFSPVVATYSFVAGVLAERYSLEKRALNRGHTFASLARAGVASALSTTTRTAAWVVGTSAVAAVLREGLHMGPRYNDPAALADASLFPFFATNAVAGGVVARLLTTSFSPDVRRPLVLAAIAAGLNVQESLWDPLGLAVGILLADVRVSSLFEMFSPDAQMNHIQHSISSLPEGRVRTALESTLRELELSAVKTIGGITIAKLRDAHRFPFPGLHTPQAAVSLALHTHLLSVGFVCLRSGNSSGGSSVPGFAPPINSVPPSEFVPVDWVVRSADEIEEGSFCARYVHPRHSVIAGAPGLLVRCSLRNGADVGGTLDVEASLSMRATGVSSASATFSLVTLTGPPSDAVAAATSQSPKEPPPKPHAHLAALLTPLFDQACSDAFCARIHAEVLSPLVPTLQTPDQLRAQQEQSRGSAPGASATPTVTTMQAAPHPPARPAQIQQQQPRRDDFMVKGLLPPRTSDIAEGADYMSPFSGPPSLPVPRAPGPWSGGGGGDFAGDLLPSGLEAAWPGPRGFHGGGSLVGPDHPLFRGGGHGPFLGGAPFGGVPPGARFDPFGPPGVYPMPPQPGSAPWIPGGSARPSRMPGYAAPPFFGPAPDHLPPPPDAGFEEAALSGPGPFKAAHLEQPQSAAQAPPVSGVSQSVGSGVNAGVEASSDQKPASEDDSPPDYIW